MDFSKLSKHEHFIFWVVDMEGNYDSVEMTVPISLEKIHWPVNRNMIFEDEKSNKFWNIVVDDTSFTVHYGKVGTDGQKQTKVFSSEEECFKQAKRTKNYKTHFYRTIMIKK